MNIETMLFFSDLIIDVLSCRSVEFHRAETFCSRVLFWRKLCSRRLIDCWGTTLLEASHLVSTKLKHQLTFQARLTVHCEHRWAPNFTLAVFIYALVLSCICDRDRVNPKLGRSLYETEFYSVRRLDCFWIFLPRDTRRWVSISNAVERDVSSGENILVHWRDVDYWWSWKRSKAEVKTAFEPSHASGRSLFCFE